MINREFPCIKFYLSVGKDGGLHNLPCEDQTEDFHLGDVALGFVTRKEESSRLESVSEAKFNGLQPYIKKPGHGLMIGLDSLFKDRDLTINDCS